MSELRPWSQIRRRLRIVRWLALLDLVLLVALIAASLAGQRDIVRILGPLHGINFLLLLTVAATAALDGLWGWWFPAAILLTAGPLGALVGEWVLGRRHGDRAPATSVDTRPALPGGGDAHPRQSPSSPVSSDRMER